MRTLCISDVEKEIASGNFSNVDYIFEYNKDRIIRYLTLKYRHNGYHEYAEDAYQEGCLRAIKSISLFNPDISSFSKWFYSICVKTMIDILRKNKNTKIDYYKIFSYNNFLLYDKRILDQIILKEDFDKAYSCLEKMSFYFAPKSLEIINLYVFNENTSEEISSIVNINKATVRTRICLIKKKIKKVYKD